MKEKSKREEQVLRVDTSRLWSAKIIRKRSGKILRQYPAHPGYHGTQDEKDLSPEE